MNLYVRGFFFLVRRISNSGVHHCHLYLDRSFSYLRFRCIRISKLLTCANFCINRFIFFRLHRPSASWVHKVSIRFWSFRVGDQQRETYGLHWVGQFLSGQANTQPNWPRWSWSTSFTFIANISSLWGDLTLDFAANHFIIFSTLTWRAI